VVYRCEGDLRPHLVAEILEHGTTEILGVVGCNLLWNSTVRDDVLPEESLDCCGGYVGNGLRFNPFGKVLHCNNTKSVVSLRWCKFANNVNAPPLQGPRQGNQLRGLCGSLGAMGEFLTSFAG
jgi:hypothetical protein